MPFEFPEVLLTFYRWLEPAIPTLTAIGVIMALISMLAIPWLVVSMPADYFVARRHDPSERGPIAWTIWVLRNSLALVLFCAGVLMLVLPGQGLLTLLIAVLCSNFPGKYRLERRVVRNPSIFRSVNWIRQRWNRPPIEYPHAEDDP